MSKSVVTTGKSWNADFMSDLATKVLGATAAMINVALSTDA